MDGVDGLGVLRFYFFSLTSLQVRAISSIFILRMEINDDIPSLSQVQRKNKGSPCFFFLVFFVLF